MSSTIKVDNVVNQSGDNDSGLDLSTNDQVIIKTANTTAVTIDSSQGVTVAGAFTSRGIDDNADATAITIDSSENVGIGTSSPTHRLAVEGTADNTNSQIKATASGVASGGFGLNSSGMHFGCDLGGGAFTFRTGTTAGSSFTTTGTERIRINSDGHLYVNTNGVEPSSSQVGVRVSGTQGQNFWKSANSGTGGYEHLTFHNGNGQVGNIATNGSSTNYNTSSDQRLKENVEDMIGAIDRVKQLLPKRFNFIADADRTVDGFLAHEAQTIVPEAVTGTHNEVDDDGEAVMQGIDQSKLVPLLTGALKEAIAKIEELETRIIALEG